MQKVSTTNDVWFAIIAFFNHGFEFQDSVCNGCHDLTMLSVNISNIAIITAKNADYRCITHNNSKSEAINLLKNFVLEDRVCVYIKNIALIFSLFKFFFFFSLFLFSIYNMVDSMSINKFLNVSTGT